MSRSRGIQRRGEIGYLKLGFWKGLLALVVWPYYLGAGFGAGPRP